LEVILKNHFRDYLFLFVLSGIIVALDQWTKNIIRTQLDFGQTWVPWDWLTPYARIVYWHNSGAAFGMGQNLSLFITILAIFVSVAIIVYFPQIPKSDWPLRIALSMQLGGAVGNLIDRLTIGFVTDFISVGTFPVFNIADSSISVGVAVLIVGMWIMERKRKSNSEERAEPLNSQTESKLPGEEYQGE
jgi:signal peptidase II